MVLNDEPAHASTQTLDLPGLTATFFGPAGCTFNADTKYVIYVEGIDILERRTAYIIYHQMIYLEKLSQLKNFGYTFVVVDWKDSHAPLEQNSAHLRGLIEWLKCNGHPTGPKPNMPPPFVVIGESMGGLIARHALTFMEHNYMNTNLPLGCSPSYGHNTRLFISLDAPQQGANVPMGLQYIYKYINSSLLPINAYTLGALNRYVNLINGSAKEMLLYHVDTDQFPNIDVSSSSFNPHPAKLAFDANLAALGSYPTMCKMMTMSNGSARGEMQQRRWDNMARVPNDKMLDGHAEVTLRILGIRFNGSEFDVLIRTNPNGNGDLFYLKQSTAKWKIKLHWFGIKLQWTVKATREINKVGQSMIPYCVSPGSTQGYVPDDKSKSFNFLDLFGYGYSITPGSGGTLTVNASAGMGPIWNVSGNVAAYSDGGEFGFIPTQSALDYKNAPSLIHDIVTEPVATTLSRTPFDVVQLNPEKAGIYNIANRNHLYVENPVLTGSNSYDYIKCTTCLTMGYPIKSYMLNREIGDDTLFLENQNQSLPFTVIEAERSLQVNYRSPYYNYDGIPSPRPQFEISLTSSGDYAVKSKANPFAITNTSGANKLRSNDQFIINGSLPGTWQYQLGGMTICCINYTVPNARMQTSQNNYNNHPRNTSAINVYPNPNSTGSVTVKYQFKENGPVQIELYDVSGRKLGMWSPNFSDNSLESHFPIPVPVSAGVYLLKANNGKEQLTARLIVIQ